MEIEYYTIFVCKKVTDIMAKLGFCIAYIFPVIRG
jgi:hypothetical protein